MINFNEDIYLKLKPYERYLRTSYYASYIMSMTMNEAKELTSIYNELYETNRQFTNCSKCLLDLAKRLGEHYFKYQESLGMHPEDVDKVVKVYNHTPSQPTEEKKEQPKPKAKPKKKAKKGAK